MKIKLILIIAAVLPACTSLSEDPALNALGEQMRRAHELESQGYTPGDAWQAAGPLNDGRTGFGGPGFGGFGNGFGSSSFPGSGQSQRYGFQ